MATLLFVGWRAAAFEAADAMGARVFAIAETEPRKGVRPRLAGWQLADFSADGFSLDDALGALPLDELDAVVALTERSVLPAALIRERLDLPGNTPETARQCRDKSLMKQTVRRSSLACADWMELGDETRPEQVADELGLPVVVKQRDSSGSRGTYVARSVDELAEIVQPGWMAEQFLRGEEMSVESLVVDGQVRFVNPTEYLKPGWANVVPADLDDAELDRLRTFNERAVAALGVTRGITHLEVFRTPDQLYFGELAVRPPGGRLMELMTRAYDVDAWQQLLRVELGEAPELPETAARHAAIWFLHPGEGRLSHLAGLDQAREVVGVAELKCRATVGAQVGARLGTGQSIGHVIAEANTRDAVVAVLKAALAKIEMSVER